MAVTRRLKKKMARAMKRARVDRETVTAKETRVMATTVVAMMANGSKDSVRPLISQLRGSDNDNSEGNKKDEVGKGNGEGSYGDDVDERDHSSGYDGKWHRRQHESTQLINQPKGTMVTMRAVTTRAAKARARVRTTTMATTMRVSMVAQ
jgi:hypothetical protein